MLVSISRFRRGFIPGFCAVIFLLGASLVAENSEGEIRIQVVDPSGAPMKASGRLTSIQPGMERRFQTDSQGNHTLDKLRFGRYRLQISRSGFVTQTLVLDVESAAPISRTISMAIGAQASQVDVVAATPLPGMNVPVNEIPAPVQTATQTEIVNSSALDLGDFMNRRLNGVYVNEMQGNPFQPDVNYRGYTASPLLGTPEGLSVYVDGVRQNQPFGDVVSWDLIEQNAISEMAVIPGSDPVFGLNTLGGSVSITTKDGSTNPGLSGRIYYGSSGRKGLEAEWGGGRGIGFNWFFAATAFHESGWRVASPADVRQGFGRLGWRTPKTDLALTLSFAYNTLTGNGIQDYRRLQADYSSVYTIPDTTNNRSPYFNFIARHNFSDNLTLSGNAWYRWIRTETINGNANTDAFAGPVNQLSDSDLSALASAGYSGFPADGIDDTPFPSWACIGEALTLGDLDETCDGVIVYSKTIQNDFGFSGQIVWSTKGSRWRNQFTAGALFDRGTIDYTQNTQYAYINSAYRLAGVPAWQDDSSIGLRGVTPNGSLFVIDTFSPVRNWNITLAGRFNRSTIDNSDLLNPAAGPGSLTGDYVYSRFNPSIGVTYNPFAAVNFYANYSQANRAPTSIELGCADPNNPCSLPNALASDPPLSEVVTRTWEAGLRGRFEGNHFDWTAGAFRAQNTNDILFVASQVTGTGYFQNFAKTLREGVQAGIDGRIARVNFGVDYTFLSATYQSTETLDGTANNTSDAALSGYPGVGGVITVHPGNRIPLIPKQTGKAYLDIQAASKLLIDLGLVANSSSYVRGNENNAYQADGVYYLGTGVTPGYAVLNLAAHYDLTRHLQLGVEVDNLLDRHYYTAGQIENTPFNNSGVLMFQPFPAYASGAQAGAYPLPSATFFAPGAPRRAWVELRVKF